MTFSEILLKGFELYVTEFLYIVLMLGLIAFFVSKIELLIFNLKK